MPALAARAQIVPYVTPSPSPTPQIGSVLRIDSYLSDRSLEIIDRVYFNCFAREIREPKAYVEMIGTPRGGYVQVGTGYAALPTESARENYAQVWVLANRFNSLAEPGLSATASADDLSIAQGIQMHVVRLPNGRIASIQAIGLATYIPAKYGRFEGVEYVTGWNRLLNDGTSGGIEVRDIRVESVVLTKVFASASVLRLCR